MEGETLFEPFTLIGCDRAQPSKMCQTCFLCVILVSYCHNHGKLVLEKLTSNLSQFYRKLTNFWNSLVY